MASQAKKRGKPCDFGWSRDLLEIKMMKTLQDRKMIILRFMT